MTRDEMTQGEYMRRARERAGLSAKRLSEMSGVPASTISALERSVSRNGRIDTIELLADVLGLSIDDYVGHRTQKVRRKAIV